MTGFGVTKGGYSHGKAGCPCHAPQQSRWKIVLRFLKKYYRSK
jgi:hypothetical protein